MHRLQEPVVVSAAWSSRPAACAVAVGNFDGVHVGHAAIVRRLCAAARAADVPAAALTFDPHPAAVLRPERAPPPLTTAARRAELLLALGVDLVLVQPADETLMGLSARAFYEEVLRDRLGVRAIVEGTDFRFGSGREGDVARLAELAARDGVTLEVVEPVRAGGEAVSSSRIRGLIAAGRIAEANALATAAYRLTGTVVPGSRRGRTLGFPTANLAGVATLLPQSGVYAARAATVGDDGRRRCHAAAVHVGRNATFDASTLTVEAHLLGHEGDLYGRVLDVDFLDRVRDTRRFDSVDALKAQLAVDVERAAAIVAAAGGGEEPA